AEAHVAGRGFVPDGLGAAEGAVVVAIEPVETVAGPLPFTPLDPAVAVDVERLEAVGRLEALIRVGAQELGTRDPIVAVPIRALEALHVVFPLAAGETVVTV